MTLSGKGYIYELWTTFNVLQSQFTDVNTAEAGINWLVAVLAAPFVAIIFAGVIEMINLIYQSTRVHDGPFSHAQSTVHQGALASIDLLKVASSIETWVIFAIFILGLVAAARSLSSWGR